MLPNGRELWQEKLSSLFGRPTEAMWKIVEDRKARLQLALHGIARVAGPNQQFYDRANEHAKSLGAIISDENRSTDHMPVVKVAFNQRTGQCPGDLPDWKIKKIRGSYEFQEITKKTPGLSDPQAITLLMMRHIHESGSRALLDNNFDMGGNAWCVMDEYGAVDMREKYE